MIHDTQADAPQGEQRNFESLYGTNVRLQHRLPLGGVLIELRAVDGNPVDHAIVDPAELRGYLDSLLPTAGTEQGALEEAKRALFDAAIVPEDGRIYHGEAFVMVDEEGDIHFGHASASFNSEPYFGGEYRLLEPREPLEPTDEELAIGELFDDLLDLDPEWRNAKLARQLVEAGWRKTA